MDLCVMCILQLFLCFFFNKIKIVFILRSRIYYEQPPLYTFKKTRTVLFTLLKMHSSYSHINYFLYTRTFFFFSHSLLQTLYIEIKYVSGHIDKIIIYNKQVKL